MKKQLFLGMVTLLVAIPGFSQIKANDNNSLPLVPGKVNELPFMNYHGFQLNSEFYQPKGFKGVLVPKPEYENPTWVKTVKTGGMQSSISKVKPQANQKTKEAKPNSSIRYQ